MSARAGRGMQSRPQLPARTTTEDRQLAIRAPASPIKGKRRVTKTYKRSRDGCFTCRLRRKKCDENHPACEACRALGVSCEYIKPSWWISTQARNLQKERIKARVRETKIEQKETALQEYIKHAVPSRSRGASSSANRPQNNPPTPTTTEPAQVTTTTYDATSMSYLATPLTASMPAAYMMPTMQAFDTGFNTGFDNGLGSSTFVPDDTPMQDAGFLFNPMATPMIPTPMSTSTSSSSTATIGTTTPALPTDEWYQGFTNPLPRVQPPLPLDDSDFPSRPLSCYLEAKMSANDRERYLLYHFVDNVLKLVYPILDLHKEGHTRTREILHSLDTNKSYYHCCLSVSAIHLKTVKKHRGKRVEDDIMRHRHWAIWELNRALIADHSHDTILDATLAMIFFKCSVASVEIDGLLDIPWHEHFGSVTDLVNRLGIAEQSPYTIPTFGVSLSTWMDILGSTMLGKSPQFAHTYRTKHLSGISSGLRELMGCDDRIMYLISEIACLDSQREAGRVNDYDVTSYFNVLMAQLDHAEQSVMDPKLENPNGSSGLIQPEKLTKNMTAIFRLAARIYLWSLMPGFHPEQKIITDLVETVAENLQYIPAGAFGFDRSLVWPMLITGANSTPTSNFRFILEQRIANMGDSADFGSFGRMYTVLQETWNLSDDNEEPIYPDPAQNLIGPPSSGTGGFDGIPMPASPFNTVRRVKKQPIHWRDVMRAREWQYLLL